jgi:hypothetical protein
VSRPELALTPRARAAWSVGVALIFAAQIGLGVRSRVQDDDRYGFAMFHEHTASRFEYRWRMADGSAVDLDPNRWLKGRAAAIRSGGRRREVFGAGTTRIQVRGLLRWAWAHHRPEGAVAVEADWRWQLNGMGPLRHEAFRWPPEAP